jgi:hypothetical protein
VSAGSYVLGLVVLLAIAGPLGFVARRVRVRLVPDWSGSRAWLVDGVLGVALLEAIAQVLGTVGRLRRGPLVAVALVSLPVIWAVASVRSRRAPDHEPTRRHPVEEGPRLPTRSKLAIALGSVFVVALPWIALTASALRTGVLGYDSLNYHLPFAAHFFQTGRVSSLYFTFTDINSAFPANAYGRRGRADRSRHSRVSW